MTDRRLHPGNGRVVLEGFEPIGEETPVVGTPAQVLWDSFLLSSPDGRRERQLLLGDTVMLIDSADAGESMMTFVRSDKDGYVGWIESAALGDVVEPTHWVAQRTTFAYPAPDLKSISKFPLHMTSRVRVEEVKGRWARIAFVSEAWVPAHHLKPLGDWMDPIDAARAFLGTHYIWAGNSGSGLDCSGLVSTVFRAAGRSCPGDSDLQEKMKGTGLGPETMLQAGDLIFWKGHVALVTGSNRMIHANAYHMSVVEEDVGPALQRIAATDTGPVTSRLRPEMTPLPTSD